ncbi:MAG: hypothetical protein KGZ61_03825 [Sandarakinorhabdus sp.]|nr:hypothetical protein [Sandarakinorhabdus sp.]
MAFLSSKLAQIMAFLALSLGMSPAFAALPVEVTAGITTAGANLALAATAIIVALIAFWGLRKLAQKMGWW